MHFQELDIENDIKKAQLYKTMCAYLNISYYGSKEKAAPGTMGALLGSDGNTKIRKAINNAKKLDEFWTRAGKDYRINIKEMNPSVSIHNLVERLLDEIVYCCS